MIFIEFWISFFISCSLSRRNISFFFMRWKTQDEIRNFFTQFSSSFAFFLDLLSHSPSPITDSCIV